MYFLVMGRKQNVSVGGNIDYLQSTQGTHTAHTSKALSTHTDHLQHTSGILPNTSRPRHTERLGHGHGTLRARTRNTWSTQSERLKYCTMRQRPHSTERLRNACGSKPERMRHTYGTLRAFQKRKAFRVCSVSC